MELNIEGGEQSVSTYAVEPINCLKRGDTVLSLSEVFHSTSHDETDCLETVVVGEVPSSSASIVLKKLTAELPLASFALGHLKRARRLSTVSNLDILICPQNMFNAVSEDIKSTFTKTKILSVCKYEPHTRREYNEWGRLWPVVFKPNEVDRERDSGLSTSELDQVLSCIRALDGESSRMHRRTDVPCSFGAAIIVDPTTGSVLASSSSSLEILLCNSDGKALCNPLWTVGMTVIEGLAASVRGESLFPTDVSSEQYLCTGLDIYLQHEPDLVTAMGLLHSRIRRVYYLEGSHTDGALGSVLKLNDMKQFNHRFRVFRVEVKRTAGGVKFVHDNALTTSTCNTNDYVEENSAVDVQLWQHTAKRCKKYSDEASKK